MATRIGYRQPQVGAQGFARTRKTIGGIVPILTTDEVTGNVVALVRTPKGFTVESIYLALDDLDSNGTPTVAVTVGDAGSANRLIASTTIGQAGGSTTTLAATGLYYKYTVETDILLTFGTGSATAAAGNATFYLSGFTE